MARGFFENPPETRAKVAWDSGRNVDFAGDPTPLWRREATGRKIFWKIPAAREG
jgi:hypothetical protein